MKRPIHIWVKSSAPSVWFIYNRSGIFSTPTPTTTPPRTPTTSAYRQSSGIIMVSPRIRGSTRKSYGDMPSVLSASISSFTCMVPSSAAKEAPVRPAITIPVIMAPSDRTMPIPTRLATYISAPNIWSWSAPTNARISPIKNPIRVTIGRARGPQSCTTSATSLGRNWALPVSSLPKERAHSPINSKLSRQFAPV